MSYAQIFASAATQAQGIIAELQGMPAGAEGNFVGPDGATYTMTFRAADAFESETAAREMTPHGYVARSVVIATATRDQFTVTPYGWRQQKGSRLIPAPSSDCIIGHIGTEDPVHYVFTLLFRQPKTNG